jgi:hypothetical protein
MASQEDDQHTPEETQQRLQRILAGAFAGPPTPLKDIPTQRGKARKLDPKKRQRRLARRRKARAA